MRDNSLGNSSVGGRFARVNYPEGNSPGGQFSGGNSPDTVLMVLHLSLIYCQSEASHTVINHIAITQPKIFNC